MKITEPGIFIDFDEEAYFADPCPTPSLTQSIAKVLIEQTTKHARAEHPRFKMIGEDEPDEKYDKAKAIGNAAHAILIGRGKTIAGGPFDAWTTKEAKAFKAEAIAAKKMPILDKHLADAHLMVKAACTQLLEAAPADAALEDAFTNGNGEVVIAAEINGVWFRSLVDWMVNPRLMFDYKTTGMSVAPHALPKLMADAGWPIQAAMQDMILDILDPEGAGKRRFFFIGQENYDPFELTISELPRATMQMGHKLLAKAEGMWREAITTGVWSGYARVIHRPEYPGWMESQILNREIAEAAQARVPKRETMNPENLMAG